MRPILIAAALSLAGGACYAQATPGKPPAAAKFHTGSSTIRPIDKGPYTPQANAAYQGGGVILQGAPGAPAPRPQPTPPGLLPKNAVPHG
jgi:hypothetical protein